MRRGALVMALALALTGCAAEGEGGAEGQGGTDDGGGSGAAGTVTVFAAASLKTAFTGLAASFEAAHPGTDVTLSFAGSSDLATQLIQGAPADVFASADIRNMEKLQGEGLVDGEAKNFATNILTIVVPPDNPAGISGFRDLARPGVKLVICARQVPCGAAAHAIEEQTGAVLNPVSEETAVTDVLGKVTSGEADAGLVYATDARSAGPRVTEVALPEAADAVSTYPITTVTGARNKPAAERFVEFVLGPEGQAALAAAGFGKA